MNSSMGRIKKLFSRRIALFALIALSVIFCFANLTSSPLAVWDEYTNFNVVYDTIGSENPLLLQLNGEPFFEKPPLWYYLAIFSTKLFGVHNLSLRIISALSGFFMILTVFYLGWKMFSYRAGIIAGFGLLATQHLWIVNHSIFSSHTLRTADLDALQLLFILLTVVAHFKFIKSNNHRWLITSGVLTGLGFLTKGPFALLPLCILNATLLIQTGKAALPVLLKANILTGAMILVTTAPWYLYMLSRFGNEFISRHIAYHLIQRTSEAIEGHHGNALFYITLLFRKDFFFSGELLLLSSIIFLRPGRYRPKLNNNFSLVYCLIAVLLMMLTTIVIQTKLSWYIFPLYPFAALLIGKMYADLSDQKMVISKILRIITIVLLVIQMGITGYTILVQ